MTLEEATNITLAPIHELFDSAIDKLGENECELYLNKLESLGNIDDKLDAAIASLAFSNQPNHEEYDNAINSIKNYFKSNHKGNINELMLYRRVVPIIIHYVEELKLQIYGWKYTSERLLSDYENSNKRWSKEDDNELIEMACNEMPEIIMAATLKRSPSSIKTRITYLVGVKRLSQQVAGKFIGTANGEEFSANLVGTVYKK